MGTWGFSVMHDDDAADAYADVMRLFNAGVPRKTAIAKFEKSHKSDLKDPDYGPPTLFGMAKAMWDCGWIDAKMIRRVAKEIESGRGLLRWEDEGPKTVSKRKAQLGQFLSRLKKVNSKSMKPKPPTQRVAPFRKADCLSYRLDDGRYAALVVLDEEPVDPRRKRETYGTNLVGVLDWIGKAPPTMDVFKKRKWLRLTHHSFRNELAVFHALSMIRRQFLRRVNVVGVTTIRSRDPKASASHADWSYTEQIVLQERWAKKSRRSKRNR